MAIKVQPPVIHKNVLDLVGKQFAFDHAKGLAEWLKNSDDAYWQAKIAGNVARDAIVNRALRLAGWRVLRVWEHELALKNQERLKRRLATFING